MLIASNIFLFFLQRKTKESESIFQFFLFSIMALCRSDRYNKYGYLDLKILSEYAEYANSLCEFVLNTITIDYVVRISLRNNNAFLLTKQSNNKSCISLNTINLDTDFIPYGDKMRRIWYVLHNKN